MHVSSSVFHNVFLCQLHTHTYPHHNVLLEAVFFVVFQEINCLHTSKHDVVRGVISLPRVMFVSAPVSEQRENRKSEIDHFQFKTFPAHINLPIF